VRALGDGTAYVELEVAGAGTEPCLTVWLYSEMAVVGTAAGITRFEEWDAPYPDTLAAHVAARATAAATGREPAA
jgi:hypothetical protein